MNPRGSIQNIENFKKNQSLNQRKLDCLEDVDDHLKNLEIFNKEVIDQNSSRKILNEELINKTNSNHDLNSQFFSKRNLMSKSSQSDQKIEFLMNKIADLEKKLNESTKNT